MKEVACAVRFLTATLGASFPSTLVYPSPIPHEAEGALSVTFKHLSTFQHAVEVGGLRVLCEMTYEVVAVAPGSTIEPVYEAGKMIDLALHKASGVNVDGRVDTVLRVAPIQFAYVSVSNVLMQVLGGTYRLFVVVEEEIV